jgi:hypothetical protein
MDARRIVKAECPNGCGRRVTVENPAKVPAGLILHRERKGGVLRYLKCSPGTPAPKFTYGA